MMSTRARNCFSFMQTPRKGRTTGTHSVPTLAERVDKLKIILGVDVNSSLTAADHVSSLLASCSSLLYALCVLRSHGLPDQSLKDVFHATVIGKLMYRAPAWHGFYSASDYVRLDSFLRRWVKPDYTRQSATVTYMFSTTRCFVKYCATKHTHTYLIGQKLSTRFAPDLIISLLYV